MVTLPFVTSQKVGFDAKEDEEGCLEERHILHYIAMWILRYNFLASNFENSVYLICQQCYNLRIVLKKKKSLWPVW